MVNGTTALELVRSRHLEYKNTRGYWESDGLSDFSRIQRQDAFFRAVLAKVNTSITNPLAINGFISAAVGNLTIDDTMTQGDLFHLATEFRGLVTAPGHRDAAHHELRHRRRRRRPLGSQALRRPDDRGLQPDRPAQAQAGQGRPPRWPATTSVAPVEVFNASQLGGHRKQTTTANSR